MDEESDSNTEMEVVVTKVSLLIIFPSSFLNDVYKHVRLLIIV